MRAPDGSRSRLMIVVWLGLAAGGGPLVGCHRNAADQAGQGGPSPDAVKQSFAVLKKQFGDLQQSFSSLSEDVEAIPANLPGFPQLRAHFYAVEEVRGVTDARVAMLSGRLESALRSGKRDELQQVSNDIDRASNDCRKIGALYIKLLHEVMAFQRAAEQRKPALAAASETPSPAKTKQSKSKP
jgi:hypothetical protein